MSNQSNLTNQGTKGDRKALKPNPFTTYRDSQTGRWIVVKSASCGRVVSPSYQNSLN